MSDSSSSDSDSDSEGELCLNHSFTVLQDYQELIQSIICLGIRNTTSAKYPTLSRMVRDFLAIPVSLATSYEAFYSEPRPVHERIISMKPELMNALMCARNWSHSHWKNVSRLPIPIFFSVQVNYFDSWVSSTAISHKIVSFFFSCPGLVHFAWLFTALARLGWFLFWKAWGISLVKQAEWTSK